MTVFQNSLYLPLLPENHRPAETVGFLNVLGQPLEVLDAVQRCLGGTLPPASLTTVLPPFRVPA